MSSDTFCSIARRRFLQTGGAVFVATATAAVLAESIEESALKSGRKFASTVAQFPATAVLSVRP